MTRISDAVRLQVLERGKYRCEYCQTAQRVVVIIEIDHIIPTTRNGATKLDNLCVACRGCNQYKSDFITGIDPLTGTEVALFNPRIQAWSAHFQWDEAGVLLIGLTEVGRATIQRL